ncbi:hypothetical protein CYMTET_26581 [Cymbomonas tetramitiformis]|uniref:NAD-dependent epimerase/dehydratase domain-containing protein n=1 Tax=Cymbomonas tetramitiformis TaxID=36881 RepID=A0AAE0FRG4_9CHLO|nr:hypothetical protein CYMTET_26581 [Cymbomonas tetramitiformis]
MNGCDGCFHLAAVASVQRGNEEWLAYGADKYGCELHGRVASHVHGVPNVGFRFFNVYGPRQDPSSPYSGVIAIFTARIAAQQKITIFGDGKQCRDFVNVKDVVRYLIAAMKDPPVESSVYCLCTGKTTNLLQLAEAIGHIVGITPQIEHGPERVGDIRTSFGDPSLINSRYGFSADITLNEGLIDTVKWSIESSK